MMQRGRKSSAQLAVVGAAVISRIAPPNELTDKERGLWLDTVNSKPAEWFGNEHIPMLVEYVRHVSTADLLTREIQAFTAEMFADTDELKKLKILTSMRAQEASCINTFARSMRLTQQSIYRADKAATLSGDGEGKRKPWQQE